MTSGERKMDYLRARGLRSRSTHLGLSFLILSFTGVYVALATHRFQLGLALIVLANVLFVWCLTLHSRSRDIMKKWEKEPR